MLPLVLAVLIGILVSFAVQGFISFVSFVESYLRGDEHLLLGLPKELLVISGPIIAGIIVSIIFKLVYVLIKIEKSKEITVISNLTTILIPFKFIQIKTNKE